MLEPSGRAPWWNGSFCIRSNGLAEWMPKPFCEWTDGEDCAAKFRSNGTQYGAIVFAACVAGKLTGF